MKTESFNVYKVSVNKESAYNQLVKIEELLGVYNLTLTMNTYVNVNNPIYLDCSHILITPRYLQLGIGDNVEHSETKQKYEVKAVLGSTTTKNSYSVKLL